MDLKVKFGMDTTVITDETCIIVIKTDNVMTGILVDKVSEVVSVASEDIEDTPSLGTEINSDFLLGVSKTGGRIKLLLDIEKIITASDFIIMKKAISEESKGVSVN